MKKVSPEAGSAFDEEKGDIEMQSRDHMQSNDMEESQRIGADKNGGGNPDVDFTYAEKRIIAKLMPTVDSIIGEAVDSIWKRYDKDNSGQLDREETMRFFRETLYELGETEDFDEKYFEKAFEAFDKDGSGTISQLEMHIFIKQMVDL